MTASGLVSLMQHDCGGNIHKLCLHSNVCHGVYTSVPKAMATCFRPQFENKQTAFCLLKLIRLVQPGLTMVTDPIHALQGSVLMSNYCEALHLPLTCKVRQAVSRSLTCKVHYQLPDPVCKSTKAIPTAGGKCSLDDTFQ